MVDRFKLTLYIFAFIFVFLSFFLKKYIRKKLSEVVAGKAVNVEEAQRRAQMYDNKFNKVKKYWYIYILIISLATFVVIKILGTFK